MPKVGSSYCLFSVLVVSLPSFSPLENDRGSAYFRVDLTKTLFALLITLPGSPHKRAVMNVMKVKKEEKRSVAIY